MDKISVVKLRTQFEQIKDKYQQYPVAIKIFCDNAILADGKFDSIQWDDTNSIVYIIKQNPEKGVYSKAPIEVIATTYENIQYIVINCDEARWPQLATIIGLSDIQRDNVLAKYAPKDSTFITELTDVKRTSTIGL